MKYYLSVLLLFFICSFHILIAQDTIGGVIWYPPIQISEPGVSGVLPKITVSGEDTLCITWWSGYNDKGEVTRLPLRRSIDGGRSFSPIQDIMDDTTIYPYHSGIPKMHADGNKVYIMFPYASAYYPYKSPLRLIVSTDAGFTWERMRTITSDNSGWINNISIQGDSLSMIYQPEQTIELKLWNSTNRGVNWSAFYNGLGGEESRTQLLGKRLHLAQYEVRNNVVEVEYRYSTNLGFNWKIDSVLSPVDGYYSTMPVLNSARSACGSELILCYRDARYGGIGFAGGSLFTRTSLTDGKTWMSDLLLTMRDKPNGFDQCIAINKNVRAVGWAVEVTGYDTIQPAIRYTNSSLSGYGPIMMLEPTAYNSGDLSVAVSSHAIHTVYMKENAPKYEIWYRRGELMQSDAQFFIETGMIEFDTTVLGVTAYQKITVYNTGKDPLIIGTAIANDMSYSVYPETATISGLSSACFIVSFTPVAKGTLTGKILFYHNGPTSPDCITVTGVGIWGEEKMAYTPGWQLVSISLRPGPQQTLPSLFSYSDGYIAATSMAFGKGYWAKPPDTVTYIGGRTLIDSVAMKQGWNLVGALSVPVPVTHLHSLNQSILDSPFYGFSPQGYYEADTLQPGAGYWIKVKEDGLLVLRGE